MITFVVSLGRNLALVLRKQNTTVGVSLERKLKKLCLKKSFLFVLLTSTNFLTNRRFVLVRVPRDET